MADDQALSLRLAANGASLLLLSRSVLRKFGPALRRLREERHMTQLAVQAAAELGTGTLSEWENERSAPHLDSLDAILAAMGANLHDLANALDKENARSPLHRPGQPRELWVRRLFALGDLREDSLVGLALGLRDDSDPAFNADFRESVGEAARYLADRVLLKTGERRR